MKSTKFLTTVLCVLAVVFLMAAQCTPKQCLDLDTLPPSQLVAIGDSVMAFNYQTCQDIPGVLSKKMNQRIPQYAMGGSCITPGSPRCNGSISGKYFQAKQDIPGLNTVIMTGGGNDLRYECPVEQQPTCIATINQIEIDLKTLFDQMIADGMVVVYIAYYNFKGVNVIWNEAKDISMQRVMAYASTHPEITYVDPTALFNANPKYYFVDGIHPSTTGSAAIADLVYQNLPQPKPKGVFGRVKSIFK